MPREQNIINIPAGLPGLPGELTRFTLSVLNEDSPFFFLECQQDENIAFIIVNPFFLFPDYEFNLPDEEAELLDIKTPEQLAVFCIVNASQGLKNATVNLLAPLVLNTATGSARQVVLNDRRYSIRHPLPQPKSATTGEGQ